MNSIVLILFLSVGVSPLLAQDGFPIELDWAACAKPRTVLNFNPLKFVGIWYDVQRYKNAIFNGKCATATFTWNLDNEVFNLTYTNLDSSENIELRPKDLINGEFRVYRNGRRTPLVLYVLDTDYVNYAVMWSCTDIMYGVGSAQTLNIFSRTRTIDQALLATATNAITSRNLDETKLQEVAQERRACGRRRRDD